MSEIEGLIDLIHAEVLRVLHRTTRRSPVVVDSYDPQTHAAKFKLMPDSDGNNEPVITGWIPLHPQQTGNGAGWHIPPNIGDHGWIEFHDDDREGGTFQAAVFNDKFPPDKTVQAGEWKYIHPKTKTKIYYDNSGNITITGMNTSDGKGGGQDNSKQTIILKADGSVTTQDRTGVDNIVLDGVGNITTTSL
jgi:phage baseplate assembly protein gpV